MTHGHFRRGKETPTHRTWRLMLQRVRHRERYSKVKICCSWLLFENFLEDMGERPDGMTIDRIDNNRDYCPENCRWATRKEQALNRMTTTKVVYRGEVHSISEWAELLDISYSGLYQRLQRGWSAERAIETPFRSRKSKLV